MYLRLVKKYLPKKILYKLKPFYRKFYRNKLHIIFYPTFRCNYNCSYCLNHTKYNYSESLYPLKHEKCFEEWITVFEKLPKATISITGGEPFLYKDLPALLNNFPKKHSVSNIFTNLSASIDKYSSLSNKIPLTASFHNEYMTDEQFIEKIKKLSQLNFPVNVNFVASSDNIKIIGVIEKKFKQNNVQIHVDPCISLDSGYTEKEKIVLDKYLENDRDVRWLGFKDYSKKKCSAGRNYIIIFPDGDVFSCMGGFYYSTPLYKHLVNSKSTEQFYLGNIFSDDFKLNKMDIQCSLPCQEGCDLDLAIIENIGQ